MDKNSAFFGSSRRKSPAAHISENGIFDRSFRFVALDVETANGDASSICQIGLACVSQTAQITTFSVLIDPEMHFDVFNINLHGIDPNTVHGQPRFQQVFPEFQGFLSRHPLVQHSSFDKRAIEAACRRYDMIPPSLAWHDSVKIARRAWPEFKGNGGHGLANLKRELHLNFDHHDAEEDARAAAEVVLLAENQTGCSFQELAMTVRKTRQIPKKPVSTKQIGKP